MIIQKELETTQLDTLTCEKILDTTKVTIILAKLLKFSLNLQTNLQWLCKVVTTTLEVIDINVVTIDPNATKICI